MLRKRFSLIFKQGKYKTSNVKSQKKCPFCDEIIYFVPSPKINILSNADKFKLKKFETAFICPSVYNPPNQ